MKRWVVRLAVVACLGSILSTGENAFATTLGMDAAPLGSRAGSSVEFAYWDSFTQTQVEPPSGTTYTFHGVAEGGSTLTGLSLTQGAAHALNVQGSGLLVPTGGPVSDAYYSSTQPQSWTLNATSSLDIQEISFQIKTANVNESVLDQLFVPTLVGIGAGSFHGGAAVVGEAPLFGGFASYVLEYRWTGLNIAAGTPLTIQFAMAGGSSGNFTRKPVDFVSLDVQAVPEPSTIALLAIGAVALCGFGRRFR